jgi:hypothetical protein
MPGSREYTYDISLFVYSKEDNSFYADGWDLFTLDNHHSSFPNDKEQFFIVNGRTGNRRRFRFAKQTPDHYLFESEDSIRCVICINPDFYETLQEREIPQYPSSH